MRSIKLLVPALLLALLAAVLIWRTSSGSGPDAESSPARSEPETVHAERGDSATRRPAFREAAISGSVKEAGIGPAEGAVVIAAGPSRLEARTGADGTFLFEGLAAGDYTLFAKKGERASEPMGPIPLAPGEELREVALVLDAGAALSGTVLGLPGGGPVPGAVVSAGAARAVADEKGRYRLSGLPAGTLAVSAQAEGFLPRSSELELTLGWERTGADIHLERAAQVFGRVSAGGRPVSAIEIHAARYGFGGKLSELTPVGFSDGEGAYAGWVPPGRIELVARGGGWAESRSGEVEIGAGEEREVDLSLSPGATVFGSVRDAEGAGVPGCQVQAFDAVHGRVVGASASGAGGDYWIAALPQAVYLVVASCREGRAEREGVRVSEGAQERVELALGNGVIAGTVEEPAGKPVAGALVSVRLEGSAAPETPVARTGPDGRFEARGLSGERFAVSASGEAGKAELTGVPAGARDVVLVLGDAALQGVAVSDRGEPVPDFVVYAEPQRLGQGKPQSQHFLSPSGEFRMPVSPGAYDLKVGAPGYASASVTGVVAPAGGVSQRVRAELRRGYTVSGVVIDEKRQPLAGASVATSPSMLWAFGRAAPVTNGSYAVSGADGSFELQGVPAGERVTLLAHKDGYRQQGRRISVPRDASGTVLQLSVDATQKEPEREFAGVGMSLGSRDGRVIVVEVFEAGPARAAGIRPGDEILQVDGMSVSGLPIATVVESIRGLVGTTVRLLVRHDGREQAVAVPRATIKL